MGLSPLAARRASHRLQTVGVGEIEVEEHELVRAALESGETFLQSPGDDQLVRFGRELSEANANELGVTRVVLDEQDA